MSGAQGLADAAAQHPDALAAWVCAGLATIGVVLRPLAWPEAVWALAGALALVLGGWLPWRDAVQAAARGSDVYLFLAGMMLIAEMARQEGLFAHVAARAVRLARGSGRRLFALVFAVGTAVTVLLSNDATAVVLTPAVLAVASAARARRPLPYLLACAFVANAASFVLPISNPANLVVFQGRMPPLAEWLARFGPPSLAAIVATFAALWAVEREAIAQAIAADIEVPPLGAAGRCVAGTVALSALALLAASALGADLGRITLAAAALGWLALARVRRAAPWQTLTHVSWSVLPLVAGLFVLVEAIERTGVLQALAALLLRAAAAHETLAALGTGLALALGCNVVNNLPAGLFAGSLLASTPELPRALADAVLIAIDLGPNLSVSGSLATLLWLVALRREGVEVGARDFLRVGLVVMPAALLPALLIAVRS